MNNIENNEIKIGVLGGDTRQVVMAKEFAACGFETAAYGFDSYEGSLGEATRCVSVEDAIRESAIIILPLPFSADNIRLNCPLAGDGCDIRLSDIFEKLYPEQIVTGGRLNETARELADKAGVRLFDYYSREELSVLNAIPTAEGAIAIAMTELPVTIHGSKAQVLGFGRVGKVLAKMLAALGAEVTVAARKHEDFAWVRAYGYKPMHIRELYKMPQDTNVIFNTVPDMILNRAVLSGLNPETLIIDLASKPGGVDMKAAKELNMNVIWALSLPGKVAPVTSGRIIMESILNIMHSEGVTAAL